MEAINLSQISQTNFTNKQEPQNETSKAPEQKKDGAKLLALGAVGVTAVAIACIAIKNSKKARKIIETASKSNSTNVANNALNAVGEIKDENLPNAKVVDRFKQQITPANSRAKLIEQAEQSGSARDDFGHKYFKFEKIDKTTGDKITQIMLNPAGITDKDIDRITSCESFKESIFPSDLQGARMLLNMPFNENVIKETIERKDGSKIIKEYDLKYMPDGRISKGFGGAEYNIGTPRLIEKTTQISPSGEVVSQTKRFAKEVAQPITWKKSVGDKTLYYSGKDLQYTQTRKSFDKNSGNVCLYREYVNGYPMVVLKNNKHKFGEVMITDGTVLCADGKVIKKYHADDIKNFNMEEFLELISNKEAYIDGTDGWHIMPTDLSFLKNS